MINNDKKSKVRMVELVNKKESKNSIDNYDCAAKIDPTVKDSIQHSIINKEFVVSIIYLIVAFVLVISGVCFIYGGIGGVESFSAKTDSGVEINVSSVSTGIALIIIGSLFGMVGRFKVEHK
ncbi:hypothetical protein [Shewanella glacialipiscicola]|uniref:hypothetical protein n=1 Tax=Shewanella glacialipiscicola TaxID=614069 RepID=UPI003D7A8F73